MKNDYKPILGKEEIECIVYKVDFQRKVLLYKVPAKELLADEVTEEEFHEADDIEEGY